MKAYDIEKQEYVEITEEEMSEWQRDQRKLIANQDAEIKELRKQIEKLSEIKDNMVGIVDACIQAMFAARSAIKKMQQGN